MTVFGVLLFFAVCGVIGVIFALMPSDAPREHYNPQRDNTLAMVQKINRRVADQPKPEGKERPKPEDTGAEAWGVIHVETYGSERYTLSSERFQDEWRAYGLFTSWGFSIKEGLERWYDEDGRCYDAASEWVNVSAASKLNVWLDRHTPDHSKAFWQSDTAAIRMSDVKTYYVEKHEA